MAKDVYLGEYEPLEIRENDPTYPEFAQLPPGSFRLVTVERKIDQDGAVLRIVPGCRVGAERIDDFTVIVRPKIAAADFFTMANFAFDLKPQFVQDIVNLARTEHNLTAFFLYGFLCGVSEFVRTGLKSAFVERKEELQSKAKGRILLDEYISRQKPIMKDHVVPCRYFEINYNCLENRILRYTIEVVHHALVQMVVSHPLRRSSQRLYTEIIRRMPSVSSSRIALSEFKRVHYAGKFAAYKPIHDLCALILESIQMDLTGGRLRFQSFAIDMNALFERFVIGVLRQVAGVNIVYQKGERFLVGEHTKKIQPDGWIADARIVIDTKYKESFAPVEREEETVVMGPLKIKNSDIYQMVAYCNHQGLSMSSGILVYPIGRGQEAMHDCYCVRGFNRQVFIIPVKLDFGWNPGLPAEVREFVRRFQEIVESSMTFAQRKE